MNDFERYHRRERRRLMRERIVAWGLVLLSAVFMVFVLWCAIIGMVVVFG